MTDTFHVVCTHVSLCVVLLRVCVCVACVRESVHACVQSVSVRMLAVHVRKWT